MKISLPFSGKRLIQTVLTVWIFFVLSSTSLAQVVLSQEGIARKNAHQFLFETFLNGRTADYSKNRAVLQRFRVATPNKAFTHKMKLELPEGSERVASMFRYLTLKGKNLDKLGGLKLVPFAKDGHMHRSKQDANFYRVQMATMRSRPIRCHA